jgi:hypothetical protein
MKLQIQTKKIKVTNLITKKNIKINGKIISKKEGWVSIHIYGEPYERGFAHGWLLYKELKRNHFIFPFLIKNQLKTTIHDYMNLCILKIKPIILNNYNEFYKELEGISAGAKNRGVHKITVDFLIAWNSILSSYTYFKQNDVFKCSAFIATGDYTSNKNIVMAHNTHCDFITAQTTNIIMKISPSIGEEFTMQTSAGNLASGTDWFICKNGIIGCETTISHIKNPPIFGDPYYCRIRKVMQYAKTLNDCEQYMTTNNAGDYACSWLFGDINTNEIMLLDLGVNNYHTERTHNGVFYGMNSAINYNFRKLETTDINHFNNSTSTGSRNIRLNYLLNEKYKGKINIENSKQILSDHHDSLLNMDIMSQRNICKHQESDNDSNLIKMMVPTVLSSLKNHPSGCVDGKVTDSNMASQMRFVGRFGSSCGRVFNLNEYINKHPEYKSWKKYMISFPKKKWTLLP